MKNLVKCGLVAVSLLFPVTAMAEGIGVVDISSIIREADATKSVQKRLDEVSKKLDSQAEAESKKLLQARTDLEKQQNTLQPAELQKRVEKLNRDYQTSSQSFREKSMKVRQAIQDVSDEVRTALRPIVEQVAQQKGFSILIDKQVTVFAHPTSDVTPEVLQAFNQKVRTLSLKLPNL